MAVDIVKGALASPRRAFDVALLVTGDADQVAAIEVAIDEGVEVLVRMPPNRPSGHLTQAVGGTHRAYHVSLAQLKKSQLPDVVARKGYPIERPSEWGERPGWTGAR
jgi:hypothetical protein